MIVSEYPACVSCDGHGEGCEEYMNSNYDGGMEGFDLVLEMLDWKVIKTKEGPIHLCPKCKGCQDA